MNKLIVITEIVSLLFTGIKNPSNPVTTYPLDNTNRINTTNYSVSIVTSEWLDEISTSVEAGTGGVSAAISSTKGLPFYDIYINFNSYYDFSFYLNFYCWGSFNWFKNATFVTDNCRLVGNSSSSSSNNHKTNSCTFTAYSQQNVHVRIYINLAEYVKEVYAYDLTDPTQAAAMSNVSRNWWQNVVSRGSNPFIVLNSFTETICNRLTTYSSLDFESTVHLANIETKLTNMITLQTSENQFISGMSSSVANILSALNTTNTTLNLIEGDLVEIKEAIEDLDIDIEITNNYNYETNNNIDNIIDITNNFNIDLTDGFNTIDPDLPEFTIPQAITDGITIVKNSGETLLNVLINDNLPGLSLIIYLPMIFIILVIILG